MHKNCCTVCGVRISRSKHGEALCQSCGAALVRNVKPAIKWIGLIALGVGVVNIGMMISIWVVFLGVIGGVAGVIGALLDKSPEWLIKSS